MAQQGIYWQLVTGFNPGAAYTQGLQQYNQQQNILQQLAGQEQDRQFRRDESTRNQQNTDRQFNFGVTQADRQQANADRQFGFTAAEAQRAQANADRVFALQQLAARSDDIKEVKNADGSTSLVRIPRDPNAAPQPINLPNQNQTPLNPYAPNGKMTDGQANAALYANRMAQSNDILGKFENINQGTGWVGGLIQNTLPDGTVNQMVSPQRQQVIQAQRDFLNAVLRRESGAVISPSEFQNAAQQYFPQPGDSQQVIEQKRQNRLTAIHGIMGAAGQHYQPPVNYRQQDPNNPNPQATTNPPQANQPKVQINSQAEYERLPSGSLFIMNGKSYQKP
ncbi:MAG: hypothetical protein KF826_03585 [Xanthobacteraceae bacterium]|nr:hypothetical protein [Xanthobacteraceae bacterium]